MTYKDLEQLKGRLYFSVSDVAQLMDIKQESARVLCSRYAKTGQFIRLKNNFYILSQKWENSSREDFLKIANFLQVPSYISFTTALWIYEITTQVPRDFFESASLKRTKRSTINGTAFNYYKLKKELYFGFSKDNEFFIASPEKAFLDTAYLYSFGKYKADFSAIDTDKLDKNVLKKLLTKYPQKTQQIARKLCRT